MGSCDHLCASLFGKIYCWAGVGSDRIFRISMIAEIVLATDSGGEPSASCDKRSVSITRHRLGVVIPPKGAILIRIGGGFYGF